MEDENFEKTEITPKTPKKQLGDCTKENTPWLSLAEQKIQCKIIKVYDGDTVTIIAPFENNFYKVKCRLNGIDTPEIRTKNLKEKEAGKKAAEWLRNLINNKIVWIDCGKWDKYGRLLVDIYLDENDVDSVNNMLVANGMAHKYDGKKKDKFIFV